MLQRSAPDLNFSLSNGRVKCFDYSAYFVAGSANGNRLFKEQFKRLQDISEQNQLAEGLQCTIALNLENRRKNIYYDVLPYDTRRIVLKKLPGETQDYINASPIHRIIMPSEGPVRLDFEQIDYICAQAPLHTTCGDFWRMIVENNVGTIVMLTRLTENDSSACARYWPERLNEQTTYTSGSLGFTVELKNEIFQIGYDEREIIVESDQLSDDKRNLRVLQLEMHGWFDMGVPNVALFKEVLYKYKDLKNVSQPGSRTLVHCRAGIGRSGTFVVGDILRRQLENKCDAIDLPGIILQLRRCRQGMVESQLQYIFLQEFANSLIAQSN
ncbi:hypothetical protein PHET_00586 [Paragonimus heterotremus]|uniref:Uncharacterized protein n=1 Tax=Paragonimus heterotremus TaxID=100268 RepID=A0A8J4TSL5_9TREM|nr:hypothetical protein PHET_00586 [Paragonimus heterotremus]